MKKEKKEKGTEKGIIKITLTQVIIVIWIILIVICVIIHDVKKNVSYSNQDIAVMQNSSATSNSQNLDSNVSILNDYGYWVNSNILDEKYNEHGDLIYYKFSSGDGNIYEVNFEYVYDDSDRVTLIKSSTSMDEAKYSLSIEYDKDNIKNINVTDDYASWTDSYSYQYNYLENFVRIDVLYSVDAGFESSSSKHKCYMYDENINGKEYRIVNLSGSGEDKTVIYEKDDDECKSALQMLGLLPSQYMYFPMYFGTGISINGMLTLFEPGNVNTKRCIYDSGKAIGEDTAYVYDDNGRLIFYRNGNHNKSAFKYEKKDYGYLVTEISYASNLEEAAAFGFAKFNNDGSYVDDCVGEICTFEMYIDENGKAIKIKSNEDEKKYNLQDITDIYNNEWSEYVNSYLQDEVDVSNKMIDSYKRVVNQN